MAELELVVFWVAKQKFGMDLDMVKGILKPMSFTEDEVELIDFCVLFDLSSITDKKKVIKLKGKERVIGFLVDDVSEILPIEEMQLKPVPPFLKLTHFFGVAEIRDELILLLDVEKVIEQSSEAKDLIKLSSKGKKPVAKAPTK